MIYYNKNHWFIIIINFFKIIRKFWALIILIIIPSIPFGTFGIITIFSLIGLFCIFRWLNEFIILENNNLLYKRGIFLTEKIKIPLNSVSLIESNRNIIHIILGLRRIKIESISPKDRKFEILMVLKKDKASEFHSMLNFIETKNAPIVTDIDNRFVYKVSAKHLLILSTLRSNIILGAGIIYSIGHFINDVDNKFGKDIKQFIIYTLKNGITKEDIRFGIILSILFGIIFLTFLILGFSIIGLISKYYKFKLYRKQNHLFINHGLVVRRRYSIKISNIHAIKIEQNLINQILGLYTMKASVVGYGNDMSEDEVIFPLCTKEQMLKIMVETIPEFKFNGEIFIPPSKSFNNFYISWTSYSIIFALVFYQVFNHSIIGFIAVPLMILWRYLIKKNAALGVKNDILYFSSGSFVKRISLIRDTSMVECCRVINIFQRRKSICDFRIRYYNQRKFELIRIKNMDAYLYTRIKEKMKNNCY
ncbi:MAG: PH domain-containing protein [Sarcina sp.]